MLSNIRFQFVVLCATVATFCSYLYTSFTFRMLKETHFLFMDAAATDDDDDDGEEVERTRKPHTKTDMQKTKIRCKWCVWHRNCLFLIWRLYFSVFIRSLGVSFPQREYLAINYFQLVRFVC